MARARREAGAAAVAEDAPVYVISIAADLAGMHAQTLRQYDRLGLVIPRRTRGGGRRYSSRDIDRLRTVQRLSQEEGISLAGVQRIMELEHQVEGLQSRVAELRVENDQLAEALRAEGRRVFAAGRSGEVVALRPGTRPGRTGTTSALVLWRPTS